MSSTLDWIIACERQGLLTSADVRRFRQLSEITGDDFSPRVMLKWLATRDRITAEQADSILSGPPNLTPVDSIVRILGDSTDSSSMLELDLPERGSEESEDDTKDLNPLDLESVGDLVLPPRGSPAFAGTVTAPKPTTNPAASTPVAAAEPNEEYALQADTEFARVRERLAETRPANEPLPATKSRPIEESPPLPSYRGVIVAGIATSLVVIAAVFTLWLASR